MNLVPVAVTLIVLATTFVVGWSVFTEISAETAELEPNEPIEVTGPTYDFGLLLLALPLVLALVAVAPMVVPSGTASTSRLDTSEKAIDRYKRQYVQGEMTLEEYEDRVYQTVEVEVEQL